MPYLNCYVDPRTFAILERESVVRGASIEQLASKAIESSAISTLPGGHHYPAGFEGDRWSLNDHLDLGGAAVNLHHNRDGSMSINPDRRRTTLSCGGVIVAELDGDPDDVRFTVIP